MYVENDVVKVDQEIVELEESCFNDGGGSLFLILGCQF